MNPVKTQVFTQVFLFRAALEQFEVAINDRLQPGDVLRSFTVTRIGLFRSVAVAVVDFKVEKHDGRGS